jgi:hypothetical protein
MSSIVELTPAVLRSLGVVHPAAAGGPIGAEGPAAARREPAAVLGRVSAAEAS